MTRAQPPPDQLASFYKLVDEKNVAAALCRYARNAELASQASQTAEALFGDDSLVLADLRGSESSALSNLSNKASGGEQWALRQRAWAVLVSLVKLLVRRLADNTILPGTIRDEELDFAVRQQCMVEKTQGNPNPSPTKLRALAPNFGYNTLIGAMGMSLNLSQLPYWPAEQKRMVELFVLQGLDVIPRTAGMPEDVVSHEVNLTSIIVEKMNPRNVDPTFCAAVLRKWRSNAVSSVLRARGVLQTGVSEYEQVRSEFDVRQRADIAKHGLRDCALPSCSKTEKTVKEFAGCSGCRSVVYCCLEHQALDWRAHKKACKEKQAARLAEERANDEGDAA